MKDAFFITPNDEIIKLNIYEVNNYCKEICLSEEHREKFLEFEKGYTRFDAYFDFVVFELHYIYSFDQRLFVASSNNRLCEVKKHMTMSYNSIVSGFNDENNIGLYFPPVMVKCSDEELQIRKIDKTKIDEEFWDLDGFSYANKTGGVFHEIMTLTILNQLLIKENDIYLDLEEFVEYDSREYYPYYDKYRDRDRLFLLYIMQRMGFIRVAYPLVVYCCSDELPKEIKEILENDSLNLEIHKDRYVLSCLFDIYKKQLFKNNEEPPLMKTLDSK